MSLPLLSDPYVPFSFPLRKNYAGEAEFRREGEEAWGRGLVVSPAWLRDDYVLVLGPEGGVVGPLGLGSIRLDLRLPLVRAHVLACAQGLGGPLWYLRSKEEGGELSARVSTLLVAHAYRRISTGELPPVGLLAPWRRLGMSEEYERVVVTREPQGSPSPLSAHVRVRPGQTWIRGISASLDTEGWTPTTLGQAEVDLALFNTRWALLGGLDMVRAR